MCKHGETWMILGGVALAGGLVVALTFLQQRKADPLAQANRLISRCNHKISEIEESVAGLQTLVQAA
ncbi:MAG TPA: hypothetical protein VM221_10090 [Armatimonadota bacterium]|nr:hypothetical protein [Armatimonadota bacterium]